MARDLSSLPWMRPTTYTNDVDPSHGPQSGVRAVVEHTAEEVEAMMRGERLERDERQPLPDLGDGRPNPAMADRTPMVYKPAYSGKNEVDLDDKEYMDKPEEYVPAKPVLMPYLQQVEQEGQQRAATPSPAIQAPNPNPPEKMAQQATQAAQAVPAEHATHKKKGIWLLSIVPREGQQALISINVGGNYYSAPADEIERSARDMISWVDAARMIKT